MAVLDRDLGAGNWELVRNNLSVFWKSEAQISKSKTSTNYLNSNVPNVEGAEDIVILRGF